MELANKGSMGKNNLKKSANNWNNLRSRQEAVKKSSCNVSGMDLKQKK